MPDPNYGDLPELLASADNALPFYVYRARAIEAYAGVEQAMAINLSGLLGTHPRAASIIFFRISNTSARNRINESLLKAKHGSKYNHYWNGIPNTPNKRGLNHVLNELDQRRNEIVHWHTAKQIDGTNSTLVLIKPNFWESSSASVTIADMQEFIRKCDFASRSLIMFHSITAGVAPADDSPWHDIFQQPCTYPPPNTHPLARKPSIQQTQPQSSPESPQEPELPQS